MTHDRAAILSIGDELALGQTLDTNSRWLAERLTERAISVVEHITIPDDLARHVATLRRLCAEFPLVISTGGLGPTDDDLTRQAVADLLGESLVEDADALADLTRLFAARGRTLSANQRRQAQRPASARRLPNPVGTAPGFAATVRIGDRASDVFCLPGPPGELHPMFRDHVVPALRPPPGRTVATRIYPTLGLGESDLAERLGDLMDRARNPLVGTTASGGVVTVRVRYEGDASRAEEELDRTESVIRRALNPYIFGEGRDTIESAVIDALRHANQSLVVVESCTGGLLGSMLTSVPGSSDVFLGGWITYSNEMKTAEVGVGVDLLSAHGAVSEPVARAMAEGALRSGAGARADHALAITGIAGPGGASSGKPVGTVFIARTSRGDGQSNSEVRRFLISGDRRDVRDRSAKMALAMLRFHLLEAAPPRLLWQMQLDGTPMPM